MKHNDDAQVETPFQIYLSNLWMAANEKYKACNQGNFIVRWFRFTNADFYFGQMIAYRKAYIEAGREYVNDTVPDETVIVPERPQPVRKTATTRQPLVRMTRKDGDTVPDTTTAAPHIPSKNGAK